MRFENLLRLVREERRRIASLRASSPNDDDIAGVVAEQAQYDSHLLELAQMLDVPTPRAMPDGGGLYTDHRAMLEDRLAEAGADVRQD